MAVIRLFEPPVTSRGSFLLAFSETVANDGTMELQSPSLPDELFRQVEPLRKCSYLDGERESLDCRIFQSLTPGQVEHFISRGWRKFSCMVFRPVCPACTKCVPLRVDIQNFRPSKSQRKTLRRNSDIQTQVRRATVSTDHVRLYNAWHADMTIRSGWREQRTDTQDYFQNFLLGDFPSLHEILYFRDRELVGVGLIDVMPNSISSVYFYHDPDWRAHAPGTFSLLTELELARKWGLKYSYLGFWIEQCPSMAYKNRYHPHEVLSGRPGDNEEPVWLKVSDGSRNVASQDASRKG
ncbi:MAG: arginyltransferase [Planctomycetaceae bacterium]|nr:arginyltransferase [Planctomycetaceae bacterium]